MDKIQINRPQSKKREKLITLLFLTCSIFAVTIIFILYHKKVKEPGIFDSLKWVNVQQESMSNDSCSFWHITGDEYCDDEANIVECGYDLKDCCDMDNDRTLCTDCHCYIPEEENILLTEQYHENCNNIPINAWGDGFCDLDLNNNENYFDVGDCCLENPACLSTIFESLITDEACPGNVCIQSNIFCISEELGDGICQDHNNGPFCQYDLGDCCFVPGNLTDCDCNCSCKKDNFIYEYDIFG